MADEKKFEKTITNEESPLVIKTADESSHIRIAHFTQAGAPVVVFSGEATAEQIEAVIAPFDLVARRAYQDAGCTCVIVEQKKPAKK